MPVIQAFRASPCPILGLLTPDQIGAIFAIVGVTAEFLPAVSWPRASGTTEQTAEGEASKALHRRSDADELGQADLVISAAHLSVGGGRE